MISIPLFSLGGPEFLFIMGGGFLLPILALISILRRDFPNNDKLIWVLVVIFIPIMGSLLYFIFGRKSGN